jgi:hypothetical protein
MISALHQMKVILLPGFPCLRWFRTAFCVFEISSSHGLPETMSDEFNKSARFPFASKMIRSGFQFRDPNPFISIPIRWNLGKQCANPLRKSSSLHLLSARRLMSGDARRANQTRF